MIDEKELEAMNEEFGGGTQKIRSKNGRNRNSDENKNRPRQKKENRRYQASKEEVKPEMVTKTQKEEKPKQPSPFWEAVKAARAINTRHPQEEQPNELANLKEALARLGDEPAVLWQLVNEVLEDKTPLQALFPVAREARMMPVAFNTAIVKRALNEGDLTLTDLRSVGLAQIKTNKTTGKPYITYYVGEKSLAGAIPKLREAEKQMAANILAEHLRKLARRRELAQATHAPAEKE